MSETRTCTVFKYDWTNRKVNEKAPMVFDSKATFHCFSMSHEQYESGPGHLPVAIVEYPDGSVGAVPVELIRFDTPEVPHD